MKALKISLAVIVVAAIGTGVFLGIQNIIKPPSPPPAKNQFIAKIEQEIDSFGKLPDSKFCKGFYNDVAFHIDDFYRQGKLGEYNKDGKMYKDSLNNVQWKENLSKNLYAAYADKFVKQVFYVFRGSEWKVDDLKFIRSEYQTLRKSSLLEKGSPVDKEFTKIQTIFDKYDEIVALISSCKGFAFSGTALSNRFPIADVQSKIARAADYRKNNLENGYVNNCIRLHDGLREIPQALFRAHVHYLDNKIDEWSEMYSNYNSHSDYVNNLNRPLKTEIDTLDNDIYNVSNFDSEYKRLSGKWSADNTKAYNYKY